MAPVDRDKIRAHLDFIRGRLRALRRLTGEGRERFLEDAIRPAAAVRMLHTAIEAMIDIANHVVARRGLGVPKTYAEALDLLIDEGILPAEHRETFRQMVRFRNRAVHLYDEIDNEEVYRILEERLGDFDIFITAIVRHFFENSSGHTS